MRQLAEYCAKIYAEELEKDLVREDKLREYLPEDAFLGGGHRMKSMVYHAEKRVDNFLELCRLRHRERDHGEVHTEEIATLEATVPSVDNKASTRIWWST